MMGNDEDHEIWVILRKADQTALERLIETDLDLIHQRGGVDVCPIYRLFSYGTNAHLNIAKYLITKFPSLITQSYKSSEFRGATFLHIAIIKRHAEMVEWLLGGENRAYREEQLQARATGKFFSTDHPQYYGETPLALACSTNQWNIAKILLKYGASMDMVDSNGNTILHLLVFHSRSKIYTKFKEHWRQNIVKNEDISSPRTMTSNSAESSDMDDGERVFRINEKIIPIWKRRNKNGLTPLSLAAKLSNWEMFSFLIEERKITQHSFGSFSKILYPLAELDREIPNKNENIQVSALEFIIKNADVKLINHPVLIRILNAKWERWARRIIVRRLVIALVYLTIFLFSTILDQTQTEATDDKCVETTASDSEYLYGIHKIVLFTARFIVLAGALWKSIVEKKEMVRMGICSYFQSAGAVLLENSMACAWCAAIISANILRFFGSPIETAVLAFAAVVGWVYMLFFLMAFELTGPFVVMIYQMLVTDVLRFCIIYAVFLVGFSQAFFILFGYNGFEGFMVSVKQCFFGMLGDFDVDNYTQMNHRRFGVSLLVVYIFTVTILLLNLLIAMMGNTYQKVIENATEIWQLHRARIMDTIQSEKSAEVLSRKAHKYWTELRGKRYLEWEEIDNDVFRDDVDVKDNTDAHGNSKDIKEDKTTEDTWTSL